MKRTTALLLIAALGMLPASHVSAKPIPYNMGEYTPVNAALHSLILPGWGQHFNEEPVKGYIVGGAVAATFLASLYFNNQAEKAYDDYEKLGIRNDKLYSDYETRANQAATASYLAAGIWIYGVVDAYISAARYLASEKADSGEGLKLAAGRDVRLVYTKRF